ncbi:DedA family protein [soil metagenome]
MEHFTTFSDYFNPEALLHFGGVTLLLIIVFAESGLFLGFFLPGDSLLFVAGLMADSKYLSPPVLVIWLLLIVAAVAGAQVGFWFGKNTGNYLEKRKESLLYKRRYLEATRTFYARYGNSALILGRFLPIVRTFIPILAGMVKMDFKKFGLLNIIGASIWVSVMFFLGYGLGNLFPTISEHIELIVVFMVLVTTIPVWITVSRQAKKARENP